MNNIEQQFFKAFGIESKEVKCDKIKTTNIYICLACPHYKNIDSNTGKCLNVGYPEITDRKLLEMICILQGFKDITFNNLYFKKIEDLKNEVLSQIYKCKLNLHEYNAKRLQHQIQQLFEEAE